MYFRKCVVRVVHNYCTKALMTNHTLHLLRYVILITIATVFMPIYGGGDL